MVTIWKILFSLFSYLPLCINPSLFLIPMRFFTHYALHIKSYRYFFSCDPGSLFLLGHIHSFFFCGPVSLFFLGHTGHFSSCGPVSLFLLGHIHSFFFCGPVPLFLRRYNGTFSASYTSALGYFEYFITSYTLKLLFRRYS